MSAIVVFAQDGNYRMVEVARIEAPEDAGAPASVTATFDKALAGGRPTSVRVEYHRPVKS